MHKSAELCLLYNLLLPRKKQSEEMESKVLFPTVRSDLTGLDQKVEGNYLASMPFQGVFDLD